MNGPNKKYWPFSVLPEEQQSQQHRAEMAFLESATHAGFRAYVIGIDTFGAESTDGREGDIVRRGKRRWEIVLYASDRRMYSMLVDDFNKAAHDVLRWLGGDKGEMEMDRHC